MHTACTHTSYRQKRRRKKQRKRRGRKGEGKMKDSSSRRVMANINGLGRRAAGGN